MCLIKRSNEVHISMSLKLKACNPNISRQQIRFSRQNFILFFFQSNSQELMCLYPLIRDENLPWIRGISRLTFSSLQVSVQRCLQNAIKEAVIGVKNSYFMVEEYRNNINLPTNLLLNAIVVLRLCTLTPQLSILGVLTRLQ